MATIIAVEHISKAYRLGAIGGRTLQADVARWWVWEPDAPDVPTQTEAGL